MRQLITGIVAAAAVMTVSAAPAAACGGLFSSCSPCGGALLASSCSPCGVSYSPCGGYGAGYGYGGYSGAYAAGVAGYGYGGGGGCGGCGSYETLPVLSPQYYHVNQGPTYTGPGNYAPYPAYSENVPYGT